MTTLDIGSITSQKIALGFIEVPACQRLRDEAAKVPADRAIVEIGAYKGRSTGWLVMGAQSGNKAHVFSVDAWEDRPRDSWPEKMPAYVDAYSLPETRAFYENHLDVTGIRPFVTPIQGWSTDVAKAWKQDSRPPIGLLFHDASHEHDEVVADLKAWLPLMAKDAVAILHDAGNPTMGVYSAAEEVFKSRRKWDWQGRELNVWPKAPTKRGTLTVRTK